MRTFVLGDVHGAARAMGQVFTRSGINPDTDRLIFLGDVVDGWSETNLCVDLLLEFRHLVFILGNHDEWFREWLRTGTAHPLWTDSGGWATLQAYGSDPRDVPDSHRDLFMHRTVDYLVEDERVFVHGGFNTPHPSQETPDTLRWDRDMWRQARFTDRQRWMYTANSDDPDGYERPNITGYREVFIGHTVVNSNAGPVQRCEVWNCDTGAGWLGRLSLMDVETKQWWQSDMVARTLYPNERGRY